MELGPGLVIADKLRLLAPLGQGGMGVVWSARHLTLETDVAVKFLRPDRAANDRGLLARFEREAKLTARITHPNVVRVMDFGTVTGGDDPLPFLVMELLEGFSLAQLLDRGGRLSLATARALVTQVGAALESAHALGIVHRDVKPHNVFVTRGSDAVPLFVKVLDFGVAKMLHDTQLPGASPALTETGVILGSPPYMSPEQLEGRSSVDLRADLWSLGIIVYECLTGRRPFEGDSFVRVGAAVLRGRYTPASELRPKLPRALDDWFAKALAGDPDARFANAAELVRAFEAVVDGAADEPPSARAIIAVSPQDLEHATTISDGRTPREEPMQTAAHAPPERPSLPSAPPLAQPTLAAATERPSKRRRWLALGGVVALGVALIARGFSGPRAMSSCPDGMVLVQGGSFRMGSAAEAETPSDETPAHLERVASFCLDRTEVTVAAYASCASCEAPRTADFEGLTPNGRRWESQFCNGPDAPDHPINCVDFSAARAFCAARGKRLPTEPEWELAARGVGQRTYPWGDASPSSALLNACGEECSAMFAERRRDTAGHDPWPKMYAQSDAAPATAPVGSYPNGRAPSGAVDLAGNVWEWTDSAYCPYGREGCGDSRRVLRGGGWDTTDPRDVRTARRFPAPPNARGKSIGFRCAM